MVYGLGFRVKGLGIRVMSRLPCLTLDGVQAGGGRLFGAPHSRVLHTNHPNPGRSMTYLQGGCSYRRAVEEEEEEEEEQEEEEEEEESERGWRGCAR